MDFSKEGFRAAPTHTERVFEAAQLFAAGKSGANPFAQAKLVEAFTTDDFPVLLGDAFAKTAVAAQQAAVKEFEDILVDVTVDDFRRRKLVDLWTGDAFETVGEGEEYKGGTLSETDVEHGAAKHGKVYGLTWELIRARDFSALANFPKALGNGSIKGQNNAVADLLVDTAAGNWDAGFFGTVDTAAFSATALDAAIKALAVKENHRGELVDTSNLVLLHGPALRSEVNRILRATELESSEVTGNRTDKTRIPNPFQNVVTPLESRTIGKLLGAAGSTGWALVQGKSSDLPSIVRTLLSGEEQVDIRVKKDAGARPGGGDLPAESGSFKDDTIWYRGRDVYGVDKAFGAGVYASKGA
jgi:hypothetical protein